jgi:hypothetical protein
MTVTHTTAARDAAADAVVDLVDAGAGAGQVIIRSNGNNVLATLTMTDPAFGTASGGKAVAAAISTLDSAAGGSSAAANFIVVDSNTNTYFAGAVDTSGGSGDLVLDKLTIAAGDKVIVSSMHYAAPT